MTEGELNVVTGAFGYTGKYITERLLAEGKSVRTLTGHPDRPNLFGKRVSVFPFDFDRPAELARSLRRATTLFNTYWVRFARGQTTFDRAVQNTETLIEAAREAGIGKIVHISISQPSEDSPLPYFRGKAFVEKAIMRSGLSYAIIRPTVIFGAEDILINNIAWLLRRFPAFVIPGGGEYRVQPVFVKDVAEMAVRAAAETENTLRDAVGPETYTFDALVRLIRDKIGSRTAVVHVPPRAALLLSRLIGELVRDVVLTPDEVAGLMAGLLVSDQPPTGRTHLSDWLGQNAGGVGRSYASELHRHYR